MSFPSSTDSFTGFTSTHTLSQDSHAAQHNQEQSAIVAVENKVGTGASTPTQNTVLRGTGAGTTTYDQVHLASDVSGVLATANGGTGTSSTTGTGSAVFSNSPSLTTPTLTSPTTTNPTITGGGSWSGSPSIAAPTLTGQPVVSDFTNATHTHQNAAGGGTLAGSALQNSTVGYQQLNRNVASGTFTISGTGNTVITGLGFQPRVIQMQAILIQTQTNGHNLAFSNGVYDRIAGTQGCVIGAVAESAGSGTAGGTNNTSNIISVEAPLATVQNQGTISATSNDGFTYNCGTFGTVNSQIVWTAWA